MGADIKAKSWSEVEMQFRTTLELGELVQFIAAARAAGFADTDKVSVVTDSLSGGISYSSSHGNYVSLPTVVMQASRNLRDPE